MSWCGSESIFRQMQCQILNVYRRSIEKSASSRWHERHRLRCLRMVRYCLILFCIKNIASKGRPEGFQRAIGKPFGRARRRETSALGKATVLSENSINIIFPDMLPAAAFRFLFPAARQTASAVPDNVSSIPDGAMPQGLHSPSWPAVQGPGHRSGQRPVWPSGPTARHSASGPPPPR